jgi:hypothetical protein
VRKLLTGLGLILGCALIGLAEEKKDEKKKEPPKVVMTLPLAVETGSNSTIKIRGLHLENATAIRFVDAKVPIDAKIKSKGKVEVPKPLEAPKTGDTQVEVELKLPAEIPAGSLQFIITTPDGETPPASLSIIEKGNLVPEKEPNGGFRNPQDIELTKTISGAIGEPMDVDVFRFSGKAGQMIIAQVKAARLGSALDSTLTLYDETGRVIAGNDDEENSVDSILRVRLPKDGRYLLTLIDANDRGGAAHPYLLSIRQEK